MDLSSEIFRTQVVVNSPSNIVEQLGDDGGVILEDIFMESYIEVVKDMESLYITYRDTVATKDLVEPLCSAS